MLPRLIAVIGDIGAGKSTVARAIVLRGNYTRLPLAKRLKTMLASIGLTDADLNGNQKELPNPLLLGKTPRSAMQTLGTEWGRNCIGQDFWLSLWERDFAAAKRAVVDDVRFPNEIDLMRRLDGIIIRVIRPSIPANGEYHESEAYQRAMAADFEIINDGDLMSLLKKVDDVLWRFEESKSAREYQPAATPAAE